MNTRSGCSKFECVNIRTSFMCCPKGFTNPDPSADYTQVQNLTAVCEGIPIPSLFSHGFVCGPFLFSSE